ncbi:MAG: pyridoxal-phosphate-dependent aminotransferase family protein [Alphaproteobacteria bacterium]
MSVRNGPEFLCIPGPTTIPDDVLGAMHRQPVEIYSGPLIDLTARLQDDLRRIFRSEGRTYLYAANGHGAWEAALTNVLSKGEKVLVLQSGQFATGWGRMASMLGLEVEILPGDWRRAVDPAALEARLRADKAGAIAAILIVQVDTASGVVNDIPAIRKALDAAGHGALLLVDVIASLATMPFEMDEWGVDVGVAAAQKGLMSPPGLSFTAAGRKAVAAHEKADLRTLYWDWTARERDAHYFKYCGTPPEHLLFAVRKAIDMLFEEGLEAVFERHRLLAEAARRAIDVWSQASGLEFNITVPGERADSVTTVRAINDGDAERIRSFCGERCGVTLGSGIGELEGKAFRIAHMGHINAPMILGTLGVVEMALGALGIAHEPGGVQAAIDWLGRSVPA